MTRDIAGVVLALTMAMAAPSLAVAQATSGWILWEKDMKTKGGAESVTWGPIDGYASIVECRQSGQQLLRYALDYMKSGAGKLLGPVRPDGRSAIFDVSKDGTKETLDIRYLCFPGGFDPRPKS